VDINTGVQYHESRNPSLYWLCNLAADSSHSIPMNQKIVGIFMQLLDGKEVEISFDSRKKAETFRHKMHVYVNTQRKFLQTFDYDNIEQRYSTKIKLIEPVTKESALYTVIVIMEKKPSPVVNYEIIVRDPNDPSSGSEERSNAPKA
jgi:hypothetical protein